MTRTRNILATRNARILEDFAASRVLLAFDYDGTLSPIAATPRQARMRARTRDLLVSVSRRYPCVVISGRALADISRRVRQIPLCYVFGNHGLEPLSETAKGAPGAAVEWLRHLRRSLPDHPGVVIEDKKHTVTIHYRQAKNRATARAAIGRAVHRLPDARVIEGVEAVNVLPRNGGNKGVALRRAMRLFDCRRAIFVGDDVTDEDAFGASEGESILGIRVGSSSGSVARYHVPSQRDVDELLITLRSLRPPPSRKNLKACEGDELAVDVRLR